ncbi:F-box/FBD/LRR-repeat protein At5g53840 [Linum perenne]
MMKEIKSSIIADSSSTEDDDDRISSLPDEILHEILNRLRSHKQFAKAALLSKRWKHLWLSYPVLEFYCRDYADGEPSRSTMDSFIAAATRKLSSSGLNSYIKSFRIVSCDSAFIRAIFDLIQNTQPEEIEMILGIESVIPAPLLNSSSRLRALKLAGCKLLEDQYKMINLRVIHLSCVSINHRVLNSVVAAAPLLEELILMDLHSVKKVEVCNHANLKHLQIWHMWDHHQPFQIVVGALDSLETMSLSRLHRHDLEIICSSELPSLKSLEMANCYNLRGDAVDKLISKSPSLLSLRLADIKEVKELKIESPTLEKLELEWCNWFPKMLMLHIDAPSLVNVRFTGHVRWLPAITDAISLQVAQSCRFELSFEYCSYFEESNKLKELKDFLRKVTQKIQFVHLHLCGTRLLPKCLIESDQVHQDDSPTPVIERVEVKYHQIDETFVHNMLWSCHPKYFFVHSQKLQSLKSINRVFRERTSLNCKKIACKCWRHQLKDVKIVSINDKEEEELMDISNKVLSTFQRKKQVLFRLIWH